MLTEGGAGGFVLSDLLTVLVIIFAIAALLLPLLLDFGLLEFVGALLTKVMRPLFKIPGRAAVDCFTSWIGDGTPGRHADLQPVRGRILFGKGGICHRYDLLGRIDHLQHRGCCHRWT